MKMNYVSFGLQNVILRSVVTVTFLKLFYLVEIFRIVWKC